MPGHYILMIVLGRIERMRGCADQLFFVIVDICSIARIPQYVSSIMNQAHFTVSLATNYIEKAN